MPSKDIRRSKYATHKGGAVSRGIPWEFTFDTWWELWERSGKWDQRGNKHGQYCMSRYGDVGPYSPSNVFIQTRDDNIKDAHIGSKRTDETKKNISMSKKGKTLPKLQCPHCKREIGIQNIYRFHFDNCKLK